MKKNVTAAARTNVMNYINFICNQKLAWNILASYQLKDKSPQWCQRYHNVCFHPIYKNMMDTHCALTCSRKKIKTIPQPTKKCINEGSSAFCERFKNFSSIISDKNLDIAILFFQRSDRSSIDDKQLKQVGLIDKPLIYFWTVESLFHQKKCQSPNLTHRSLMRKYCRRQCAHCT